MLDMGTGAGGTAERRAASRPINRKSKCAKPGYAFVALHDPMDDTFERVFIATGTTREVASLVRQANYWHGGQLSVIAKARMSRRQCATAKGVVRYERLRGHWYAAQSEAVDRLLIAYHVNDVGDRDQARAWFAACLRK